MPVPHGDYDIPLMLQDRAFSSDGELDYDHDGHHGTSAGSCSSMARPGPCSKCGAEVSIPHLERIKAMPIRLALSTDQPMTQIATDQGLLPSPVVLPTIGLAMANASIVTTTPAGSRVVLENRRGVGPVSASPPHNIVQSEFDVQNRSKRTSCTSLLRRSIK